MAKRSWKLSGRFLKVGIIAHKSQWDDVSCKMKFWILQSRLKLIHSIPWIHNGWFLIALRYLNESFPYNDSSTFNLPNIPEHMYLLAAYQCWCYYFTAKCMIKHQETQWLGCLENKLQQTIHNLPIKKKYPPPQF